MLLKAASDAHNGLKSRLLARTQPLDQSRQQAPDLIDLTRSLGVQRTRHEPKIPREKEIILKFVSGPEGVKQKAPEIRVTASTAPLGDV